MEPTNPVILLFSSRKSLPAIFKDWVYLQSESGTEDIVLDAGAEEEECINEAKPWLG